MSITSNASSIANQWGKRRKALTAAALRGMRKAVSAVEREQVVNLSGSNSAAPGSYPPVPNRTGNLFRSAGSAVKSARSAIVFNSASYAAAVHKDRPFLDDAVETAQPGVVYMAEVSRAILQ